MSTTLADPSPLRPARPRGDPFYIPLPALRPLPKNPTLEELRERLQEVEAAKRAVSRTEYPHTGARAKRNAARLDAWLALDEARDWLRFSVHMWPHRPTIAFPAIASGGRS